MYILPKQVKEIVDAIGGAVTIMGSEEAINKLVNDEIRYSDCDNFLMSYKIFNDPDTSIRYIACTKVPNDYDRIYILPTEQSKENNNEQNDTIYYRITGPN